VITTPPTRHTEPDPGHEVPSPTHVDVRRAVTAAQVNQAVLQLRECPRQTAVEQVQAVLRALNLKIEDPPAGPEIPTPH
jgi:hypothetical protein